MRKLILSSEQFELLTMTDDIFKIRCAVYR